MPIYFSQGYSVEDNPKKATVCLPVVYVTQVTLKAVWPRGDCNV